MTQTFRESLGGAEREFRLGIGQLRELQEKCEAGPATILARLISVQPQAAGMKRPEPQDYVLSGSDPDFIADFNIYSTLRSFGGDWRVDDVRETIRLGLIGAGMTPTDAFILVSRYVDTRPLGENFGLAAAIILKSLASDTDDEVGKPIAEATKSKVTGA